MSAAYSKSKEYRTWRRMIARCHDANHGRYPWYGAKGIAVCQRWRDSFHDFLSDMGPAPTPDHTIDRKDGKKGYEPDNCRWATMKEQAQNRSTTRSLEHDGVILSIAGWAERKGLDRRTVWKRLKRGWSPAEAVEGRKAA